VHGMLLFRSDGEILVTMAKRRRTRTATRTQVVRVPAARSAAPIIRVQAPRAAPVKRRRGGRRRRSGGSVGGGALGGLISNESVQMFVGGGLYGLCVKHGLIDKLPALPVIGRTGTAAIVLDYFGRRGGGQMVQRAGRAAAVIAGYQLGSEGSIHGDAGPAYDTPEDSYGE